MARIVTFLVWPRVANSREFDLPETWRWNETKRAEAVFGTLQQSVDLRGLFSKLAPRLRRALIVVRTVRHRPIGDKVRARHDVRQVVQPTERILAAAEARYVAGAKLSDLAPELGVSRVRLAELLRRRGIRIRHVSPTRDEVKEMTRRYETGESLERIGTKLGFNSGTVRNYLLSSGVAMRDTHGRSHS